MSLTLADGVFDLGGGVYTWVEADVNDIKIKIVVYPEILSLSYLCVYFRKEIWPFLSLCDDTLMSACSTRCSTLRTNSHGLCVWKMLFQQETRPSFF